MDKSNTSKGDYVPKGDHPSKGDYASKRSAPRLWSEWAEIILNVNSKKELLYQLEFFKGEIIYHIEEAKQKGKSIISLKKHALPCSISFNEVQTKNYIFYNKKITKVQYVSNLIEEWFDSIGIIYEKNYFVILENEKGIYYTIKL